MAGKNKVENFTLSTAEPPSVATFYRISNAASARLSFSHSFIHSFSRSVSHSVNPPAGWTAKVYKKKKKTEKTRNLRTREREREREAKWGWDGAKNKMAASQAPKNYNAIWSPFCFLTVMLGPMLPLPLCVSACTYVFVCISIWSFFFVYVEASSFHFSLGRVGAVATSSPKNPPPLRKPSFGLYFRLFTFRKLHRQTNGMKGKKKLLSRHPLDVFTRFRCQSCVNYAIKLTWMSFVQHAKQPK